MSTTPVFLDVNVPMYAAGKPHALKEACAWILTQIAEDELVAAIDTEMEAGSRNGDQSVGTGACRLPCHP